jgi:hypothetical protein
MQLDSHDRKKDMNICNTKVLYDTEFEASRAAAIAEYRWGELMTYYPCGKHFHIAHKIKEERNKYPRLEKRDYCEACDQSIKPARWVRHTKMAQHIRKVEEKEKELA